MTATHWMLIAVALIATAILGFLVGRYTSAGTARVRELERELDTTRKELSEVRNSINGHFEESARIFGQLAHDYRAFYEHFAETARSLGIPERRTNELLQQADPSLIEQGEANPQRAERARDTEEAGKSSSAESAGEGEEKAGDHGAEAASPGDGESERTGDGHGEQPDRTSGRVQGSGGTSPAAGADKPQDSASAEGMHRQG